VSDRSSNPPSPEFALNLNGSPIGRDTVEMRPVNLAGLEGSGVVFSYFYQPQGLGNAPESGDSLRMYFRNDQDEWILIAGYPGSSVQPFAHEPIDIEAAPSGSGSFFHTQFQVRFTSEGSAGANPNDDWFVDNVFLGLPAAAISASTENVMFDTTMLGMTSSMTVYLANLGTEELIVSDVTSSNQAVFFTDVTSFNLDPGAHLAIEIEFSPDQAGILTGTLTFTSNDPNRGSYVVSMTGVGDIPVGIREDEEIPTEFSLRQNYPNPFNPSTTINFGIPVHGEASLEIYDLLGSKVRTLAAGGHEAGYYHVVWDGRNDAGQFVTSGVYLYRLNSQGFVATRKMILVK
jgi:hypothetical protein